MKLVYLDNNATTRPAPEVVEAMLPCLREHFGNASSGHVLGHRSEGALVAARERVALLLGAQAGELVFTSGGTESLNHAFRGVFESQPSKRHFVISAVEHPAVMELGGWLRRQGAELTVLPVDRQGEVNLEALEGSLRPDTALVSVMAANNETGIRFPVEEIARRVRARGVLLHVDATQAVGKVPVDVQALGADLLTLSGHKFHGPKGTGALWLRRGVRLKPFLVGGHQERGRRGGTENVPALVGLGKAAELALKLLPDMERVAALRDRLERDLRLVLPELVIHGEHSPRLPNTSLVAFPGVEGDALLLRLSQEGICVSTGSACSTGRPEPSHVLLAMGVDPHLALSTLRFSLSRETTETEIKRVIAVLPSLVGQLKVERPGRRT